MINIYEFIRQKVTFRETSMFTTDIEVNKETLRTEIEGKSVCVVGGAGSIGSSFIRAVLPFCPAKLVVIDLNENGLTELTRDLRSTYGMYTPKTIVLIPSTLQIQSLNVSSMKNRVSTYLPISQLTSMCVARGISIQYKHLWRTMSSKQNDYSTC